MAIAKLYRRARALLVFFVIALVVSGLTAFPLDRELRILNSLVASPGSPIPALWPALAAWIS